jgi:hypothetical protein
MKPKRGAADDGTSGAVARRNLSRHDAAARVGISVDVLDRLIAAGEIVAVFVPSRSGRRASRVLVPMAELEETLMRWRTR